MEKKAQYTLTGTKHYNQRNISKAIEYYEKALSIDENFIPALNNLGLALQRSGDNMAAARAFQRVIAIEPKEATALVNLGSVYSNRSHPNQAIYFYSEALKSDPTIKEIYPNLYFQLRHVCDWKLLNEFDKKLDQIPEIETPFMNLVRIPNPKANLKVAMLKSKRIVSRVKKIKLTYNWRNKKIKIGYTSNGFRDFPTTHNILSLLAHHNKNVFEIYAFSYGASDETGLQNKIKSKVDHFIDIREMSAEEAAKKINKLKIDILIDLKGHTKGSRLEIFALKPSPIQISYLGFPGTTGASFLNYIIADKIVIPEKHKKYYSEKVLYMPDCYRPTPEFKHFPKNNRSKHNLPNNKIILGGFNNAYKIIPDSFDIWCKILSENKDAILWQWTINDTSKKNLSEYALKKGVKKNQLVFAPRIDKSKHISRLANVDIMLDTFPVNGHTTTVDSLLAGVPVITIKGSHFASLVSESVLKAIGLEELVANSKKEYFDLINNLIKNPEKINKLKQKLAKNIESKPLFDTKTYTKNLETLYLNTYNKL